MKPVCQHPGHSLEYGPATERVTIVTTGPAESLRGVGGVIPFGQDIVLDVCATCKSAILAADARRSVTHGAGIW